MEMFRTGSTVTVLRTFATEKSSRELRAGDTEGMDQGASI